MKFKVNQVNLSHKNGMGDDNFPQAKTKTVVVEPDYDVLFKHLEQTNPSMLMGFVEPPDELAMDFSLKELYGLASAPETNALIKFVCATMLIEHGLMDINDPISKSTEYYTTLGRHGCCDCPLVENCSACKMCY